MSLAGYKDKQKENKQRMMTVNAGPDSGATKHVLNTVNGAVYAWDHTGAKKVGVRNQGKDFSILREPANKKERKKAALGLAYRDKKGKVLANK